MGVFPARSPIRTGEMVDQHHHQHHIESSVSLWQGQRATLNQPTIVRKILGDHIRRQLAQKQVDSSNRLDLRSVVVKNASISDIEQFADTCDLFRDELM